MSYIGNKDPYLEIAKGNVAGHSVINKFGANHEVTNDTTEDVWDGGGTYSFPATATITHIRSAVDSADTRGKTIQVQGLDANWDLVVQEKDTDVSNSTTEIALDTALIRIFRMKVFEDTVLDQDIWAGDDDFVVGDAKAIIQAGHNQTLMAIYTVPNGHTAYMVNYYCDFVPTETKQPDSVEYSVWTADRGTGYEFQLKHKRAIPQGGSGFDHLFKPYFKIPEKTDIKISAECNGGTGDDAHVHAGFDLILVAD